jgi:hypothetical protein
METYRRHKVLPDPKSYVDEMRAGKGPAREGKRRDPWRTLDIMEDLDVEDEQKRREAKKRHDTLVQEIDSLFRHYYTPVIFGARYRAPCPVWRSERIVLRKGDLPRFATRVCIYQRQGLPPDVEEDQEFGLERDIDRMGGLLGFISLRPRDANSTSQVAVAHLGCPAHMKRPRYHILSTALGPPDGVMTFRGTPYYKPWVSQDPSQDPSRKLPDTPPNRAICLHASLYSALLLKSSTFHCSPISSHDLLARLWEDQNQHPCAKAEGPRSMKEIAEGGFTLIQCWDVLHSKDANAGGCLETLESRDYFKEARDYLEKRRQSQRQTGGSDAAERVPAPDLIRNSDTHESCARVHQEINFEILEELGIKRESLEPRTPGITPSAVERAALLLRNCDVKELAARGASFNDVIRKNRELPPSNEDLIKHVRRQRVQRCEDKGRHPFFARLPDVQMFLAKREARLCIAEYLANGMPVIASISDRISDPDVSSSDGHSALVVGMHFQNPVPTKPPALDGKNGEEWLYNIFEPYDQSDNFLPSSLVLHDITQAPFWEVSTQNLLNSSVDYNYDAARNVLDGTFSYLAITPRGTRCGIREVRQYAAGHRKNHLHPDNIKKFAQNYQQAFDLDELPTPENTCMRTRLLTTQDIIHWYIRPVTNRDEPSEKDLRRTSGYVEACNLILSTPIAPPDTSQHPARPEEKSNRWWCVECHSDTYRSCAFRDYETWKPPIVVYCWPIEQGFTVDNANSDEPTFTISATGRWQGDIRRFSDKKLVRFTTRYSSTG